MKFIHIVSMLFLFFFISVGYSFSKCYLEKTFDSNSGSITNSPNNIQVTIKIEFPYFHPDLVDVGGIFNGWEFMPATKINDNTYKFITNELGRNKSYDFNVRFKLSPFLNGDNEYFFLSTNDKNLSRILYSNIYINDKLINNSYVWSDNNIHFFLHDNDTVSSPYPNTGRADLDIRIPPEVHWPFADIHLANDVPDASLITLTGWAQVLHNNNSPEESTIKIDYVKLFARIGEKAILLDSTEYNSFDQVNEGGLYRRYPFFPGNDLVAPIPMPAIAQDGYLIFHPNIQRNKVWHFWNPKWSNTNSNYTSYFFEIRYLIKGEACLQTGIDFKNDKMETTEGVVSNWYFDTNDTWKILKADTRHSTVDVGKEEQVLPIRFNLEQNYPNPFNPVTRINYSIPLGGLVKIEIYDLLGEEIHSLVREEKSAGHYSVNFEGRNLSSGVYFYRLQVGSFINTKKLILLK